MDHEHDHGGGSGTGGENDDNAVTKSCKMIMVFHGGHCERILWAGWVASELWEFILSCLALLAMAFVLEAIKFWREILIKREAKRQADLRKRSCECTDAITAQLTVGGQEPTYWQRIATSSHLVQTLLYALQMTISYVIMLAFMNFNYWMCLAMILGLALGYLLFGWIKQDAYDTGDCCS